MSDSYSTVIIGGGFYGLKIADFIARELGQRVLVIEKSSNLMQRASYNNQARVHQGFHYPRSVLTALRSKANYPRFISEYEDAIFDDFTHYYAISRRLSKITSVQFERFFQRINADFCPVRSIPAFFNKQMIEAVFDANEFTFNSKVLKQITLDRMSPLVTIKTNENVYKFKKTSKFIITTDKGHYYSKYLINATYSAINDINARSDAEIIPLIHEVTEMCLVDIPKDLEGAAITVMCGPFFSLMPFPDKAKYTLSHVRYTPHTELNIRDEQRLRVDQYFDNFKKVTNFKKMNADVNRYLNLSNDLNYSDESLWELKTILPKSENDDSRPILFRPNHSGITNYFCIMGGKIDNVYDILTELKRYYA